LIRITAPHFSARHAGAKCEGDPDAIYALLSASLDLQARWLGWISRQGRVVMSAQSVAPAPKRRSF